MNPFFQPDTLSRLQAEWAAAPTQLLIDGRWTDAVGGAVFEVVNPATGAAFARSAAGGAADIDQAVRAARRAFDEGPWPAMAPGQRAALLFKLAALIERDAEGIALAESVNNGMPIPMARFGSVGGAVEQLRYNAGWATKLNGECAPPATLPGEWHAYTLREPVGVVGAIVPWNFPFVMTVGKLAAALAAGCTVVLKPAELTPLSAVWLGRLIQEAGFPPGVVNIVTGYGHTAGAALVAHPGIDKISFTGSTAVGCGIVRAVADDLKRVTLELGGKSPVIVMPDADLERAIPSAAMGIFGNCGQICAAGSRLFVHASVYDQVLEGIVARAKSLKVGDGLQPGTEMGPLISQKQRERVLGYVQSGLDEGAQVMTGGKALPGDGYFIEPTVFTGAAANMRIVREEIFGPVLCVMRFDDEDIAHIAALANDTRYGLSAAVWTRDISVAHRLARRIKAGTVRVNGPGMVDPAQPLGGYKQSGWGRENGAAGIEAYTEIKSVSIAL